MTRRTTSSAAAALGTAILMSLAVVVHGTARLAAQAVEEVPTADGYVARIVTRDAAKCFRTADLRRPDLRPQQASAREPVPARRLVLAIDASGSMRGKLGAETKMAVARSAAMDFLDRIDPSLEVGVVVFGHKGSHKPEGKAASCGSGGAETVLASGAAQGRAAKDVVSRLQATGWTPLADAIREAGRSFGTDASAGEQVVYVVSDGVETCGGDPVAAARALKESDIEAIVNIIGFDIPSGERAALEAVASAGGGRYFEARGGEDLHRVLVERLANQHSANVSRLAAKHATNVNQLATAHAVNTTRLCTNHIISTESLDMNRVLGIARRERRLDDALEAEVRTVIGARHQRLKESTEAYVAALTDANLERAAEIERDLGQALAAPR